MSRSYSKSPQQFQPPGVGVYMPPPIPQPELAPPPVLQQVEKTHCSAGRTLGHAALGTKWGRRITGVLTVATMGVGYWSSSPDTAPAGGRDSCTDKGHQLVEIGDTSHLGIPGIASVSKLGIRSLLRDIPFSHLAEDNRTWSELARTLSSPSVREYGILPPALAADNAALATYSGGKLVDEISFNGVACLTLPAPMIPGFVAADGHQTIKDYSIENKVEIGTLKKLNPGVSGDAGQILRAGSVLKVGKPNYSLVWRKMTEKSTPEVIKNVAMSRKVNDFNALSTAVKPGETAFLPFTQTPYMKQLGFTPASIIAEYKNSYDHMSRIQTITPKKHKPVVPTRPENVDANNLILLRMEVSGVPDKYARLYLKSWHKYLPPNVSPYILPAQGYEESSVQANPGTSSTGAKGIAQFEPDTWREVARALGFPSWATPLMPRFAIPGQAFYLGEMLDHAKPFVGKYSLLPLGLAGYNDGPNSLDKYGGMPPESEIATYPFDIISRARRMATKLPMVKVTPHTHPTSTGQTVPEGIGSGVYYSQTDLRWNRYPYNTNGTAEYNIGMNGCAPAEQAMYFSDMTGRKITPVDMANFNMANGYVIADSASGGSHGKEAFRAVATLLGKKVITFSNHLTPEMETYLKNGGEIELNGQDTDPTTPATPGGHVFGIRAETADHKLLLDNPDSIAESQQAWDPAKVLGPAGYILGVVK